MREEKYIDKEEVKDIYAWGRWYIRKASETNDPPLRGLGKWTIEFSHEADGYILLLKQGLIDYENLKEKVRKYLKNDMDYFSDESFKKQDLLGEYKLVPDEIDSYMEDYRL